MVNRDDLALILTGIVAGTAILGTVRSVLGAGRGGGYTIAVTALDQNGSPIQAATVTIPGVGGGVTDAGGQALIPGVPAGSYTVNIDALGFNPFSATIVVGQGSTSFIENLTPTGTCSCTGVNCPCGQKCNPTAGCSCSPQTPNAIVAPATFQFSQTWVVTALSLPPVICGMAYPGAGCPSGAPPCDVSCNCQYPNTAQITVKVTVRDISGAPVCGVAVSAGIAGSTMVPWFTSFYAGQINGDFVLSLVNQSATTDANGEAEFLVNVQIANLGTTNVCISPLGCKSSSTVSIPFSVLFSAPGLPEAATAFNMQALICGFQSF